GREPREPLSGDVDDLDVSRTVGWFTSLYPMVLEAGDAGPGEALVSAKERLRAVPERGIGYGLLRHRILPEAPAAEILFNYLGQVDATFDALSLFRASSDSAGPMQSARAHRAYLLAINGLVTDGRLRMVLTYGRRTHRRETVERLAAAYAGALRELIRHSRDREEVFTPSDFPKAGLDAHSLEKLAALLALKDVEDLYPLTPLQSGMLFHSLMAPDSGVYVTQVTCTLPADLDARRFRQAWERLVERHGVLRTAFLWDGLDEQPLQVVRKKVSLPWQELDWRGLPAEEQRRRLEELRHRERHTPLPLDEAPLMRFCLIRLGREHALLWTAHHLLTDGWSLPLLVQELRSVYAAPAASALPPVRQFSDYVVWLRQQDPSRAEPFWRGELAGFTAPNALGIDRRAQEGAGHAEHGLRISREDTARLQALASRYKLTLPTVTLGAWALLLSRYSGEQDVVFGNVVSGRPAALPGVETMVGMFINTLPVRVRVDGAEPLGSWLQHLQERQLARQDFEHSPLAQIQRWSEVPAGSPLFETLHVFESYPNAGDGGSGRLPVGDLRVFESTHYPVTLTLTAADQVSLQVMCDLARVDEDAARRLPGHLATLLAGMAEGAERGQAIAELPLLGRAERQQLLVEWNDTEIRSLPGCLHHEVAAQAVRTPAAVAVEMGEERWTYGRLIGSARRLARHLRTLGVGPDTVVGLCGERSPALVVGMLAVLEAGGAWLPLDPDLPAERLGFLLADAGARVLLIQEPLIERVPAAGLPVVLLDGSWDSGEEMGEALGVEVSPDHLAYVIYTSGSTGQPKGVMVPHRGICNRLRWAKQVYGIGEHDAFLQKAAPGFDVAVWESFAPLSAGARLVLAEPGRQADGAYLARTIREHRVTLVNFVPAMLAAFLDAAEAQACVSLRQVFVGGEALSLELRDRALASLSIPLDNLYGPTEITVDPTRWVWAPGQSPYRVPIGRPIGNSRLYVVDRELRSMPLGVAGELAVGGDGVTRGYMGRPGLTADRFVPDPFGGRPGGRLYRTGDLGRWLPDGTLEFLGRTDHQVKIRGVRIEPGEIEAALVSVPGVREAVVVAREEGAGDRRLVAYVTGEVAAGELRGLLRERLPDSMVPSAFVTLPALPLTPNGKVDRKALPMPELAGPRESYVAPRTREEELLAAVWAQVLRLPQVGVDDNFFELGGDSILSVQIVARSRQAGLRFTVRQIFEHQTVAALARHVTLAEPVGAAVAGQGPVEGEVPLTPIQRWFFDQGFADPHHFNQALLLEPREALDPAALERAMAAIVEHHDALRMRFDGRTQENAPAEPVTPFHQVDLSGLPAFRRDEAYGRAAEALQAGFDLSTGPLTRLCLFAPSRLLWVTHHLVVDGVSWRLLLADLEAAYRQAALPPKTSSFQEWARRLAEPAETPAGEVEYWRETARAAVPRLPVDFPEAGALVGDRATVAFELSAAETADLLQTLPAVFHTRIDEALLSALARAVAGWTGSPRLRVDLEGHGREPREPISGDVDELDVSRTVGWFTSLYPVVLEAGDAGEALVSAKERLRAVPERGIGYGLLCHRILPEAPAAEISFNYLGQVDATFDVLSLFRVSSESAGPMQSARAHRAYPLEINGIVTGGRLQMVLTYGRRTHRRETVERLAAAYAGALRELIQHSRDREEVFTPSDFPKAGLDAHSLEKLAALLVLKDVEDLYPLTPLQNGMLFHSLMAPDSGVYVTQVTCTLPADLDARRFRQAWERLVERHGVLRTAFLWDGLDEQPLQVVRRKVSLPWQELDWRDLPVEEQQSRLEELRHRELHTPLLLGEAPLTRFCLIRLGREHALLWTAHHLLLDGWSLPLLVQELRSVYTAPASALPPVRPFSDYVVWLRQQDPLRAEPFWRGELAGFTAPNALGIDRRTQEGAGHAEHGLRISREVTARLQALASRHKLTVPTVTLGAWAVLLSRYSGEEDVVFGNVVSGRPAGLPGVETMVGMFINTLPVRVRVNGAELLGPWLQHVQERQLARQDFEHSPLAQIQRWSEVPAGSPLFETLHVFESYPNAGDGGSDSLPVGDLRSFESTHYPVNLVLTGADRIHLEVKYDRTRIDGDAVLRLLGHLGALLRGIAGGFERPLRDLPLLSETERHQMLLEWNDTAVDRGETTLIHEPFETWAARTPEAVAVVWEGEEIPYGRIEERANRLARHLVRLGIGRGSLAGIHLRRGPDMIVALLAVLKAGAAYVPLEIGHPPARLRLILGALEISCLLTESVQLDTVREIQAGLPGPLDAVYLDLVDLEGYAASPPPRRSTADDLAYIIFTSGSTGAPKGVMVRHRPVINLLRWAYRTFAFSPADRVLFVTSLSFDLSVFDVFGLLGAGGSVRIATEEEVRDPERLLRALAEEPVTFWDSAPAALEQTVPFLAGLVPLAPDTRPALRLVFLSGDWIPVTLPDHLRGRFPATRVVSLGGATEATVWSNVFPVEEVAPGWTSIPYGRPIENARYHVLDAELAPCPVGIAGDLYIGGDCLADGYAREPELTAAKFLPDPWSGRAGGRLYRTGDRARYRPDGNLEFLGRLDHQVKIRGFRIELGEIEGVLAALPGVRDAVVTVREEVSGDRRLVAYVTGDGLATDELRRALRERLPDAMVPAVFVQLERLPLTANGKVDRKALPAPERQGSEESWAAPRTPVEEILAGMWAELFGLDRVGAHDHFFELGGHSLLATQVISRLRGAFGVELPLRALFEAPVLADLAARIETALLQEDRRARAGIAPIEPTLREGPLPLSFAQQRLWFIDQLEPGRPLYNIPAALRVEGPLDPAVPAILALCLGEIVRRHEVLRTVFAVREGSPAQVIRAAVPFVLPVVDLSGLSESRREAAASALAGEEAGRPFDLGASGREPLLRGVLLRLTEEDGVLALTLHHIASDGWSMGILVREVAALYAAFAEGRPSPLAELPVQYADFAAWQRSWLQGEVLEREIAFWRRQLADLPPLLELPTDRPRPAVQSFRGSTRPVRLPAALARRVEALARREGATLFMALLAGFQALLARYSGQDDLAVGSPISGRNRVEIEGLIGFFVNTLVMRGDLTGNLPGGRGGVPTFRELLGRVRETALAAYLHQDVPFEKLVEELAPERNLAHSPLFQVMLVLDSAPLASLAIRDLRLRPASGAGTTAKFDLVLSLEQRENGLIGAVEHATDLFDAATIDRLIGHYERLLEAAVSGEDQPLADLPLLSAAELHQARTEWNPAGAAGAAPDAPVAERFESWTDRTPDAIAVLAPGEALSYAEIDRRANRLARRLRALGVTVDCRVGLCAERSPAMIVAVLGILKAGAAYVPLDPAYPRERLAFMVEDARIPVLLTEARLLGSLPEIPAATVLLDSGEAERLPGRLPGATTPDSLAYVIYTSGSTGRPKGAMIPHRGWSNLADAQRHLFGLGPGDRVLQFASLSFDASAWEIAMAFGAGATLVLGPRERRLSREELTALLAESTAALLPPTVLATLSPEDLPGLATLIVGGEACPVELARAWAAGRRLWNAYG
ncbi:MAG TPA: amino acid adenylation domain-containing protein, partial [Thermoanaerobaculia bacterium]|nr:amino acid adenylation domain-containing protein [Thermoanaerobaculia bacterium]